MRIGLETLSCDDRTGIGRIVRALSREFTRQGHDVHIVTRDPGSRDDFATVHRVVGFPRSKGLSKVLFRLEGRMRLKPLRCDVTYSFGVGRGADVIAAQSCHRAGMEILESYRVDRREQRNWGLYDLVSLADERALLTSQKTRQIIACSNLVKGQIVQQYGVEPDRVVVIPNGVDVHPATAADETLTARRTEWGISDEDRVLLFVGNEFGRKGLQTVLEAMARLAIPNLRLFVAGAGSINNYERLTAALRLTGKVRFLGSVERPERLFGIADLFVFPTLYDPCPLVVLEAMAAGVPVITSRSCGAVEGMTHGLHGIYLEEPTSAGELAGWIRTLIGDGDLCSRLSAEGRGKVKEMCWEAIADRTLKVLESATLERGRQ